MKKLISFLLVVMMLCTAVSAFAEALDPVDNALIQYLTNTDDATKDIAMQVGDGKDAVTLVIRGEGKNFHMVMCNGDKVEDHLQLNDMGMYLSEEGDVKLLRYDMVINYLQDIIKEVDTAFDEAVKSIPENQIPTKIEVRKILRQIALLASVVVTREEADANILSSAATAFAGKFKAEDILDVKQEDGTVEVSLRSEAYASAMADAMDELMQNRDLAALVDREAKIEGGKTFAEIQQAWAENRETVLETIRTTNSTDLIDENGHMKSHFQIGKGTAENSVLVFDNDVWLDVENDGVEFTASLRFENEDPFMVYEYAMNQYRYREKMTVGDSMESIFAEIEDNQLISGSVVSIINGVEVVKANFGPDHLAIKGTWGSINTIIRETLTGKIRYELVVENADRDELTITMDYYQDDDSLVCEMYTGNSFETVKFRLSRIDKIDIEDLSTAEKITEITVDDTNAVLESVAKLAEQTNATGAKVGLIYYLWATGCEYFEYIFMR